MSRKEKTDDKKRIQIILSLGLVIDNYNNCLLIRRNEPNNTKIHNRWELPGGKIEFGEQPSFTAEREVLEETGVIVSAQELLPFPFVAIREYNDEEVNPIILCFRCLLISVPTDKKKYPAKVFESRWIHLTEIGKYDVQDGSRFFLQPILQQKLKMND